MAMNVVIMAAGKGTRMKSACPKVLHEVGGRSLLQHVLLACEGLGNTVIITGHGAEAVEAATAASGARFVRQVPQLGTGHAIQQAVPALNAELAITLILSGDVPLIRRETIERLAAASAGEKLALLTIELADPSGYGRILRDEQGAVRGIVEDKDASDEERRIGEIYSGIMAAPTAQLARWVMALTNDNAQREYYLTDVVKTAIDEGVAVVATRITDQTEVLGVNSPHQLADLERRHQRRIADALMTDGVRLADPARLDVRGTLRCAADVQIDVNCVFEGQVQLGEGVTIGANCVIRDATVEAGAVIHPFTHIEGARVGALALVGPFARLRPGADLGREVHIGNFVEVKNSTLAAHAKANHLAYLGDATVGERVNVGAGSITANYDGANKHRTVIGNDVHIGSNCVLVAPITIGDGATLGGGSTLSKDVPAGQLTVARSKAVTIPGWQRPKKAGK